MSILAVSLAAPNGGLLIFRLPVCLLVSGVAEDFSVTLDGLGVSFGRYFRKVVGPFLVPMMVPSHSRLD